MICYKQLGLFIILLVAFVLVNPVENLLLSGTEPAASGEPTDFSGQPLKDAFRTENAQGIKRVERLDVLASAQNAAASELAALHFQVPPKSLACSETSRLGTGHWPNHALRPRAPTLI